MNEQDRKAWQQAKEYGIDSQDGFQITPAMRRKRRKAAPEWAGGYRSIERHFLNVSGVLDGWPPSWDSRRRRRVIVRQSGQTARPKISYEVHRRFARRNRKRPASPCPVSGQAGMNQPQ